MSELKIGLEPDNFVQMCVDTFFKKSGGFEEFKYAGAIATLAIATERRISMPLNFATVFPNAWLLFLGESSSAGKSTTFNEYTNLLNRTGIGSEFSQVFSKEVLPQALETEAKRYIFQTEVAGLLAGIHRKGGHLAGLQDELAFLYDCPDTYTKELTKSTHRATNIFINCLWCTTLERFEETTEPSDLSGGLMARFLIFNTTGAGKIIPITIAEERTENGIQLLADRLQQINRTARLFRDLRLIPSEASLEKYNAWHTKFISSGRTSDETTLIARLRIYAIKLAMLYYVGSVDFLKDAETEYTKATSGNLIFSRPGEKAEAFRGSLTVPDRYFDLSMEQVAGFFFETMSTALVQAVEYNSQNNITKVLRLLQKAPNQTLTRSEVMRKVSGRLPAKELNDLLDMLEDEGEIWTEFDNSLDKRGRQKNTQIISLIDNGGTE